MSQEPGIERGGASIARASKRKWGYDADQVDAFLERAHALYESDEATLTQRDIQNVSFDLAKGGYDIVQVDAALSRLERAVVDKQTTRQIGEHGRVAWKAQTEDLYRQLASHASRVHGERFNRGQKKRPSYDLKQVDRLIDDVIDKSAAELGVDGTSDQLPKKLQELKSSDVSNAVFTQRKGKRGYDERQVDFFLNSCVQLLSRLESYARVADYVQSEGESAAPIASKAAVSGGASSAGTPGVAPLFAADPQRQQPGAESGADGSPSSASADNESFDALHQAEQAIFTASAASAAAAASAAPTVASAASATPQPASVAPSFEPSATRDAAHSGSAPASSAAPANPVTTEPAASAPASDGAVPDSYRRTGEAAQVVDSSLAQLAQMAEAVQAAAQSEPSSFQPRVPELSTPSVDEVPVPAAPAPSAPAPAAPQASQAPAPWPPHAGASGADAAASPAPAPAEATQAMEMPASFAPAVKPEHMATTRTASSAAFGGAARPADDRDAFASDARNAVPVPSAPAPASSAASFPVSPVPAPAPVSGADDQAASQPKSADTGTSGQQDKQDKDQSGHDMFPSLFPQMADKVSVDIPDLSFPSLYGNDDASKKHAQ
ncbi:MAG: DivIVA domain-containing protein [Bifidobacterium scardovii]|uniref:DivIVA domain-containing protein n=1 Tax=Bifidobacterium scardovii TaxID=158787 RepID=UPI0029019EBC|nr:DivIVA domain-containing protein [Bifidobacterium scardovii]MDU2420990.1 DivIVA domain-containing protein [Bifidobacterium scardovii]